MASEDDRPLEKFKKPTAEQQYQELAAKEKAVEQQTASQPADDYETVKAFDELDEKEMKHEMAGRVIEEYAYQFKLGNRVVTGLSYSGVMAAASKQGHIKILDIELKDMGDSWFAKCRGRDDKNDLEIFGVATQPKKMKTQYGEMEDTFATIKCCMKSQRNVIRRLINETAAKVILEDALKKKAQREKDAKVFM